MTVSAVVDIVHGELLNTPSINRIETIRIDAKKVKRGDLYIPLFGNDLPAAIENGAYAAIVPKKSPLIDDEVAWIGVEDPNRALLLLLRYLLVEKSITFYYLEEPLFSLASGMLARNKEVLLLEGSVTSHVEALMEREEVRFCLSSCKETLEMLSSSVRTLRNTVTDVAVSGDSLVLTKLLSCGEQHVFNAASRFKDPLAELVAFCKEQGMAFDTDLRSQPGLFSAHYLTANMKTTPKATAKVLILDTRFSEAYVQEGVCYLKEKFRWARILFFSDEAGEGFLPFTSCDQMTAIMRERNFDIAYAVTKYPENIFACFESKDQPMGSLTLF